MILKTMVRTYKISPENKLRILQEYLTLCIQEDKENEIFDEYLSRKQLREALIEHNKFMLGIIEKGWEK